jgi:hypothetical protein
MNQVMKMLTIITTIFMPLLWRALRMNFADAGAGGAVRLLRVLGAVPWLGMLYYSVAVAGCNERRRVDSLPSRLPTLFLLCVSWDTPEDGRALLDVVVLLFLFVEVLLLVEVVIFLDPFEANRILVDDLEQCLALLAPQAVEEAKLVLVHLERCVAHRTNDLAHVPP